jgi:hypothetical protein
MTTLEALERRLEAYSLKTAEIRTKPVKKTPPASSKYGGRPDLPADVAWPIWSAGSESYPFTFLGQVALEDVARFDQDKLLPKSGLLSFFALVVPFTDPAHTKAPFDLATVIHVPPRAKLSRKAPPAALSAELLLPESRMSFRGVVTRPRGEGVVIGVQPAVLARAKTKAIGRYEGLVKMTDEEWTLWNEQGPEPPPLQMLGHPRPCEFPIGQDPDARLLLSAHVSAGLPWDIFGRNGHMFFYAPSRSIRERKWKDVALRRW